ncbi:MAG: hypothetical protein ACRD96_08180, partial [Bryobacteraceae bacterium]
FVGGTCTASATSATAPSSTLVANATRVKEQVENAWMNRPGVLGVGVGADETNPGEAVIVVYVEHGASPNLPAQANGVRVRRVLTDPFVGWGCCQKCR